ncbi:MAG: sugar ABC transporter substrate-binding protein [Chloroflexi bacterium]|nr:sugar ABC transporter substrate-binding protein [Chloroflexota bacterium]
MFNNMKAVRALLIVILLLSTGAITLGQDQVTLGFVYGSFAPQEKWELYFEDFLAENPNVTINYIPVPLDSWGDYTQKIVTTMLGGEQVDVIWNAIEAVPMMAERGVLMSLDSFIEGDPDIQEFLDDAHPKLLEGLRWKDQQYLLPFAWNTTLIYYNKAVLEAAGLPEPPPDWSWDDFLEYAQTITQDTDGDGNNDVWGFHSASWLWHLGPWAVSNGSFFLNEDFTEPWYTKPETIEAFQFVRDMIWEHEVIPAGSFNFREAFVAGTLGMMIDSPAGRQRLIPAGMSADEYDVNFFPSKAGETVMGSQWGTDGYGITQDTAHPELAWEMVKHLVSTDVMSHLLSGEFASASAPARRSLASDPVLVAASPANYSRFYDVLEGGRTVINAPYFAELAEIHDRYMSLVWSNEMSVEEAAANIQSEMEAVIADA